MKMNNYLDPLSLAVDSVVNIPFGYTSPEPTTKAPCNTQQNLWVCLKTIPWDIDQLIGEWRGQPNLGAFPERDFRKVTIKWTKVDNKTVWSDAISGFYFEWPCIAARLYADDPEERKEYKVKMAELKTKLKEYCEGFTGRKPGASGDVYELAQVSSVFPNICEWPAPLKKHICLRFFNRLVVDNGVLQVQESTIFTTQATHETGSLKEFGGTADMGDYVIYTGPRTGGPNKPGKDTSLMLDVEAARIHPNYDFDKWVYKDLEKSYNRQFNLLVKRGVPPVRGRWLPFIKQGKCEDHENQ